MQAVSPDKSSNHKGMSCSINNTVKPPNGRYFGRFFRQSLAILGTNIKRGLCRTLSNIYDGAFWENSKQILTVDYFYRKIHQRCLTVF